MPTVAELRKQIPGLDNLTDYDIAGVWAKGEGVSPETAMYELGIKQDKSSGFWGDVKRAGLQGGATIAPAIGGLVDIPIAAATGMRPMARAGEWLSDATGINPERYSRGLEQEKSPEYQAGAQEVQKAEGFVDSLGAYLSNPRQIADVVAKSAPGIGASGVLARGARAMGLGARSSLMAGEGGYMGGSVMSEYDPDLPDQQRAGVLAGVTGVGGGALGLAGRGLSKRFGFEDIDAIVAGVGGKSTTEALEALSRRPLSAMARIGGGMVTEGGFEELPQTLLETGMANLMRDLPVQQGMGKAAAAGLLAGSVMGGIANIRTDRSIADWKADISNYAQTALDPEQPFQARAGAIEFLNKVREGDITDEQALQARALTTQGLQQEHTRRMLEENSALDILTPEQVGIEQQGVAPAAPPDPFDSMDPNQRRIDAMTAAIQGPQPGYPDNTLALQQTPGVIQNRMPEDIRPQLDLAGTPIGSLPAAPAQMETTDPMALLQQQYQAQAATYEQAVAAGNIPAAQQAQQAMAGLLEQARQSLPQPDPNQGDLFPDAPAPIPVAGKPRLSPAQAVAAGVVSPPPAAATAIAVSKRSRKVKAKEGAANGNGQVISAGAQEASAAQGAKGATNEGQGSKAETAQGEAALASLEARLKDVLSAKAAPPRPNAEPVAATNGTVLTKDDATKVAKLVRTRKGVFEAVHQTLHNWDKSIRGFTRGGSEVTSNRNHAKAKQSTEEVVKTLHTLEQEYGTKGVDAIIHAVKATTERAGVTEDSPFVRLAAAWSMYKDGSLTGEKGASLGSDKLIRPNFLEQRINDQLKELGVEVNGRLQDLMTAGSDGVVGKEAVRQFLSDRAWQGFSAADQTSAHLLYNLFKRRPDLLPKVVFAKVDTKTKDNGSYDPKTKTVTIYPNGQDMQTVLHELIHAATAEYINRMPGAAEVKRLGNLLTTLSGTKGREELARIRAMLKEQGDAGAAALGRLDAAVSESVAAYNKKGASELQKKVALMEFVSYGLTNYDFQQYLKAVTLDTIEGKFDVTRGMTRNKDGAVRANAKNTVFGRFVDLVTKIITGKSWKQADTDALTQFVSDTTEIFYQQWNEAPDPDWIGDAKELKASAAGTIAATTGKPFFVRGYHGTKEKFTTFDKSKTGRHVHLDANFVALLHSEAKTYAGEDGVVLDVFTVMRNPLVVDGSSLKTKDAQRIIEQAQKDGHDGIVFKGMGIGTEDGTDEVAVFNSDQIRAAGNTGGEYPTLKSIVTVWDVIGEPRKIRSNPGRDEVIKLVKDNGNNARGFIDDNGRVAYAFSPEKLTHDMVGTSMGWDREKSKGWDNPNPFVTETGKNLWPVYFEMNKDGNLALYKNDEEAVRSTDMSFLGEKAVDTPSVTLFSRSAPLPAQGGVVDRSSLEFMKQFAPGKSLLENVFRTMFPKMWGKDPTAMKYLEDKASGAAASLRSRDPKIAGWVSKVHESFNISGAMEEVVQMFKRHRNAPVTAANEFGKWAAAQDITAVTKAFDYMDALDTDPKTATTTLDAHVKQKVADALRALRTAYDKATAEEQKAFEGLKPSEMLVRAMTADNVGTMGLGIKWNKLTAGKTKTVAKGSVSFPVNSSSTGGVFYPTKERKIASSDPFVDGMAHASIATKNPDTYDLSAPYTYVGLDAGATKTGGEDHVAFRPITTASGLLAATGDTDVVAKAFINTVSLMANAVATRKLVSDVAAIGKAENVVFDDRAALLAHLKQDSVTITELSSSEAGSRVVTNSLRTPGNWVKVPTSESYGELSGKIVSGPVWSRIQDSLNRSPVIDSVAYNRMLTMFKGAKTRYNPPTIATNIVSNFALSMMHGIPFKTVMTAIQIYTKYYLRPATLTSNEIALMSAFHASGATLGDYSNNEVKQQMYEAIVAKHEAENSGVSYMNDLANWAKYENSNANKVAAYAKRKGTKFNDAAAEFYSAGDNVFRLAALMTKLGEFEAQGDPRSMEDKLDAAGAYAKDAFLDYDIDSRAVNFLRQTALPFASWPYAFSKVLFKIAKTQPWNIAKLVTVYAIVSAALSGSEDDEDEKQRQREGKDETTWFGANKEWKVWGDGDKTTYFNAAKWFMPTPLEFKDNPNGFMGMHSFPSAITPSNPLFSATMAMFGYDPYTGKLLSKDTDEDATRAYKHLSKAAEQFVPPWMPKIGGQVAEGRLGPKKGLLGNEGDTATYYAKMLALPVSSVDEQESVKAHELKIARVKRAFDAEISSMKRAAKIGKLDGDKAEENIEALKERREERLNELKEMM